MIGRADSNRALQAPSLTDRQRVVLDAMRGYLVATGEPCSVSYLSRRLALSRSTVRDHLEALHRKGWLPSPYPSDRFLHR